MTHNHPACWNYPEKSIMRIGNSFSKEDLIMAVRHNVAEERVVTANYTFVMKRPDNGWGVLDEELSRMIDELSDKIEDENMDLIERKIITPEQAAITHWHKISINLSEKYGWKYSKSKTR